MDFTVSLKLGWMGTVRFCMPLLTRPSLSQHLRIWRAVTYVCSALLCATHSFHALITAIWASPVDNACYAFFSIWGRVPPLRPSHNTTQSRHVQLLFQAHTLSDIFTQNPASLPAKKQGPSPANGNLLWIIVQPTHSFSPPRPTEYQPWSLFIFSPGFWAICLFAHIPVWS